MITATDIELYVEGSKSVCREVFSSIVSSRSNATRSAAVETAIKFCKLIKGIMGYILTDSDSEYVNFVLCAFDDVKDLMILVEGEVNNGSNTSRFLSHIPGFKSLMLRLLCYVYDLDFEIVSALRISDYNAYLEITDAIFLAGLYLLSVED